MQVLWLFSQQPTNILENNPPINESSGIVDIRDLVSNSINYWEDGFKGHWAGIGFGINSYLKSDYSNYPENERGFLDNTLLNSNVLHLNLLQFSKGLQANRNTIGLVSGLGLGIQSYRLDDNTTIEIDANGKIHPATLYFDSNQKSKLSSLYLNVPLLLEFQIPIKRYDNRFYISAGVVGSKLVGSQTKIKYRKDNKKQKLKTADSFSRPEYKISATIRMGYRWMNIYASADLAHAFRKDLGPELHPFTIGITVINF